MHALAHAVAKRVRREAYTVDLSALTSFPRPSLLTYGDQSLPFYVLIVSRLAETLPRAAARHCGSGASPAPESPGGVRGRYHCLHRRRRCCRTGVTHPVTLDCRQRKTDWLTAGPIAERLAAVETASGEV